MVLNSGLRGLAGEFKKIVNNSRLNETITAKLHMSSKSDIMPQTAIAGDLKL